MRLFSKKTGAGWGRAALETALEEADLGPLLEAVEVTASRFGSPVAQRLADEVIPGPYKGSRSAVNSLRREGISALPSIPIIATWVQASLGRIPDD